MRLSYPRRSVAGVRLNDAVMVQMGTIPVGGRVVDLGDQARPWVDICAFGSHVPQQYRVAEVELIDRTRAESLGFCGECLGYGSTEEVPLGATIDLLPHPCPTCTGTGRPACRVAVQRGSGSITAQMSYLDHSPVLLPEWGFCLACGLPAEDPGAAHT